MSEVKTTDSVTAPAALELGGTTDHPYSHLFHVDAKIRSIDSNIEKLLSKDLEGCGQVHLYKIDIKYRFTDSNQSIRAGFCEVGSTASIDHVSGAVGGLSVGSGPMTIGYSNLVTLMPMDTLSRQIRPNSSVLPMLKFLYQASDGVVVNIAIYLKIMGLVVKYRTWTVPTGSGN